MNGLFDLTEAQIERYSRQILVAHFGGHGQQRLLQAEVAVYGTNALAERIALGLARSGVGCLHLHSRVAARVAARCPESSRMVAHEIHAPGPRSATVYIDAGLGHADWHEYVEPAVPPRALILRTLAIGGVGLVGMTTCPQSSQVCIGWFFDRLLERCVSSPYEACALEWCAAWTNVLVLRHLAHPGLIEQAVLYRYDVVTGNIDEFPFSVSFHDGQRKCD